mmetsp:Transcript_17328/g.21895  ORF Transcript_17328/g.21895 Transcript_17328/m.21895 type:complete len:236 (-) Transcript_17328:60-767(-)
MTTMILSPRNEMRNVKNARIELQEALALHTKMGDPRKLAATLQNARFLNSVPLDPVSSNKVKAAERQAASDSAVINGVKTVADSKNFGTLRLLRDLTFQLCQINELELKADEVYETLVLRMSRTLASVDAYSKLKRIIRASNLSLIRDDVVSKFTGTVEVWESEGFLHANVSTPCTFGLVRNAELKPGKVDINQHGLLVNQRKSHQIDAWIKFDVMVVERINLTTGESTRIARLI